MKELFEFLNSLIKQPLFWLYSGIYTVIFFSIIFVFSLLIIENNNEFYEAPTLAISKTFKGYISFLNDSSWLYLSKNTIDNEYEELSSAGDELFNHTLKEPIILDNISYLYEPRGFESKINRSYIVVALKNIINSNIYLDKNLKFNLVFHSGKNDRRGMFQIDTINLYDILNIKKEESIAVFTHELGHYIDIVFLSKKGGFDNSDTFYNISWESKNTKSSGSDTNDFVSGYAMTNKFEDFSETFTYYVLHNRDFATRAKKSQKLQQKYDFFSRYVFKDKEFMNSNFSMGGVIKDYYWDVTKIDYDIEKYLNYLQSSI